MEGNPSGNVRTFTVGGPSVCMESKCAASRARVQGRYASSLLESRHL